MQQQLITFFGELAKAMHISGANAHDLERHIRQLGRRFGVDAHCFALPTMLTITLESPEQGQHSRLLRLPAYDYNMSRLIALKDMLRKLDRIEQLPDAILRLETIMAAPLPWKP
ncbi:threonine/serine exporter family protein, partial [Arenimonas sp. GDDSR-1]|uniref:threonine/serine exporter family protein n=1 Tax=Arenimonas sp. GDDSR-1 TaxID=2950125 RepID=UPI00261BA777